MARRLYSQTASEAAFKPASFKGTASPFMPMIEMRAVRDLKPNERNARVHSARQVEQIAESIRSFGWVGPIVVDGKGTVLSGHGRLQAAVRLGMPRVPTIPVKHLTPAQQRAFMLADNRLAELAEWNEDVLAAELKELLEFDIDVEVTGFDLSDLEQVMAPAILPLKKKEKAELVPEPKRHLPAVSAIGDVWKLGEHRLLCGRALEDASYEKLLGEQLVQFVFTTLPYGNANYAEFGSSGILECGTDKSIGRNISQSLARVMSLAARYSVDGAIHEFCTDWRGTKQVLAAAEGIYSAQEDLCVWTRTGASVDGPEQSAHELIFVFKVGAAPLIGEMPKNQKGRPRTNVWNYPVAKTAKSGRTTKARVHSTAKPLAMVVDALTVRSAAGGVILDPFLGRGTTLLAAEKAGRIGRGIEADPHNVDVVIERWQEFTGMNAVHIESGQTFAEKAGMLRRQADAA